MIIFIVAREFVVCFFMTITIAVGNGGGDVANLPMDVWTVFAVLQLIIHYTPRGRNARYGISLILLLITIVGVMPGKIDALTYIHQSLLIASVAVLPQFWLEWFCQRPLSLGWIGLAALPLGVTAWSLANIFIVKAEAEAAAAGKPYCLLVSSGKFLASGYRQAANDDWSLSGWRLFSGRGGGGSGNCCQWDFHALLPTQDQRLFNWSYKSQRFEVVSERTKHSMGLGRLSCL